MWSGPNTQRKLERTFSEEHMQCCDCYCTLAILKRDGITNKRTQERKRKTVLCVHRPTQNKREREKG